MHELSVATAILNTSVKHAGGRPVEVVALKLGAMRQVVPWSLTFYWDIVARDTVCEGSRLELELTPARLRCDGCAHEWEPELVSFRCPECESGDNVSIVGGEELSVEYLELKEPVHA